MLKRFFSFLKTHKSVVFGVLLVGFCVVSLLLPKYLLHKKVTGNLDTSGVTYSFEDDISDDSSEVVSTDYSEVSVEPTEVVEYIDSDSKDFITLYDNLFYNFSPSNFRSNYLLVSPDVTFDNNVDSILDCLINYYNCSYRVEDKNTVIFNFNGTDVVINLRIEDNQIVNVSYTSSFDSSYFSPENLSLLRALSKKDILDGATDVYYDALDNICYIDYNGNYIKCTDDALICSYILGEIDLDTLVANSQALVDTVVEEVQE